MAISVNTNVTSMKAQNQLNGANSKLSTSMERLSSGLRINSAKDDAAGLQISNRMTSQISGIGVAMRNANDGISIAQTAEGAMQESTNILQRMRDLSLQSANGSNSADDRAAMQKELSALQTELTRIAETTSFGGQKLLDGNYGTQKFQVGSNANETISVSLKNTSAATLGSNDYNKDFAKDGTATGKFVTHATDNGVTVETNLRLSTAEGSTAAISYAANASSKTIATAINTAVDKEGLGVKAVVTNKLTISSLSNDEGAALTVNGKAVSVENLSSAKMVDVINQTPDIGVTASLNDNGELVLTSDDDIAISIANTAADAAASITNHAGKTATLDDDENQIAVGSIELNGSGKSFSLVAANADVFSEAAGQSKLTNVDSIDIGTADGAQNALSIIDAAIAGIDSQRADLGAVQNRMNFTINNLSNIQSNVSDARSRIQDVDFASETAQLTKQQILSQTSSAMLAQANQLPQTALSLLG
ncbi:flagellin [Shewanella sp. JNE10-2]|uniref:flagellin n=1 Tax=unclassified Shewanella TaxID=196818 RepID=UPI0020049D56|nr:MULTISPECIES: flagellin [unclassified Shewanella]MCK7630296.1 flagellin [Shewanella sp. JNE9-1]MCK7645463.1 flagellin [Shewanella sp. JNE3-1]MCK7653456.1 flagellin [Shewanella sp. JNE4-1]UPO26951.1 flagellin [Shewanella sp. JNE10-2]UPO34147.1 flagellin [Shewanella sp. JNE7]